MSANSPLAIQQHQLTAKHKLVGATRLWHDPARAENKFRPKNRVAHLHHAVPNAAPKNIESQKLAIGIQPQPPTKKKWTKKRSTDQGRHHQPMFQNCFHNDLTSCRRNEKKQRQDYRCQVFQSLFGLPPYTSVAFGGGMHLQLLAPQSHEEPNGQHLPLTAVRQQMSVTLHCFL